MKKIDAINILNEKINNCSKCHDLFEYRKENSYQTVAGEGSINAELLFIGEAPGENEAKTGLPFVGKAGQLLNNIFESFNIKREKVYICNVIKCRPPGNRNPNIEEIRNCRNYLELQIKLIKPKAIICLGLVAAQSILDTTLNIGAMRLNCYSYQGIKTFCTYHPSYLLRNPSAKVFAKHDFEFILSEMNSKSENF